MATNTQSAQRPIIAGKKIIIVGAGVAGLAFPLALRKQWPSDFDAEFPSITIYEQDPRKTQLGREGYSISIRGDAMSGGMQALQKMGILEQLLDVSVTGRDRDHEQESQKERGSFCLWDLNWSPLMQISGHHVNAGDELPAPSMRIKRDAMRSVLIDAVDKFDGVTLRWETQCLKVEQLEGDEKRVKVHMKDGNVDEGDILIVADGAGSKIRSQIRPTDSLTFQKIVMITGTARFPENTIPQPMDKNWGGVLGGGGVGLFASVVDSRSALWSLSYEAEKPRERVTSPMPDDQVQALLQEALELGKSFSEPLPTLIKATDPSTLNILNAMDKEPFAHDNEPSIIFIGDSNHAMSPFAGNGANMALRDGWDLAEQLCQSQNMEEALKTYDSSSMPRSSKAISRSHWSISMLHSRGWKLFGYRLFLAFGRFILWLKSRN